MVRIGVVGVGGWGKNHLRVLSELGHLSCFCDTDAEKISFYEQKYGVKGFSSLDGMIEGQHLEGVTICTPSVTHYEVASKALEGGLNVLVEKPMAPTSAECRKMVDLASRKGLFLTVGYIERFNPAVTELKKQIRTGKLGQPLLLEFHRENRWPERIIDTGIVSDTSVHDIDTARWIFEEEPNVVFARTGKVFGAYEDFATIMLGFRDQKTAFIVSNWITPKRIRQLSAVFTGAVATVDFVSKELRIDDDKGTRKHGKGDGEPLALELTSFSNTIENGTPHLVTAEDGLNTTKISEAAIQSSIKGVPIHLKLD
ncbi:MAG: Gfo/Idh/MocA family oxidoreductase [Thaumarchaeota archaeon]|nr:Gfo/Idh/MocA family oxidoreductase [Nitrososphaerota archaeon]MCZ6616283.1 Gfo/Idh/MocA family oxidoreductase [Nitrososphaerota archaeon]MCZ6725268.1 Gfo/Idh/MocA family oxidoreductase [Nitrososphaerota archaeon]